MSSNNLAPHAEVDGLSVHLDPAHSKSLESYHHHQASGSTLVPTHDLEPDQSDSYDAYDAYDSGPSKHAPFPETSDSQQDLLSVRQSRALYDTKGPSVPRYESLGEYSGACGTVRFEYNSRICECRSSSGPTSADRERLEISDSRWRFISCSATDRIEEERARTSEIPICLFVPP
jgi:hypothetical protein